MNEKLDTKDAIIPEKSSKSDLKDIIKFTIIALLIVIPIRMYIAQPFIVIGDSMVPTFHNGEYLIVDEITYKLEEPERGDVIVFKFPSDKSRHLIKRIIGLPGESVKIAGGKVEVTTVDGEIITLDEKEYINGSFGGMTTETLGDDEYFVMGDNRQASSDSRSWGPLEENFIVGKALIRLFPLTAIALNPGAITD